MDEQPVVENVRVGKPPEVALGRRKRVKPNNAPRKLLGQEHAVPMLAAGKTVEQVAEATGYSTSAVRAWFTDERFAARLREAQAHIVNEGRALLQATILDAVRLLARAVRDGDGVSTAAYKAAHDILTSVGLLGEAPSAPATDVEISFVPVAASEDGKIVPITEGVLPSEPAADHAPDNAASVGSG